MNLIERIARHLATLPPHVKQRQTARLLQEALDEFLVTEAAQTRIRREIIREVKANQGPA